MTIHLVLGGARSAKSSFAESTVDNIQRNPDLNCFAKHYVATAIAFDKEMAQRIKHHQTSRDERWHEHECPTELSALLAEFSEQDVVLVDCLTLWLNNVLYNQGQPISESEIQRHIQKLVKAMQECKGRLVLVSNEVGLGVVPLGEVSRLFVDHAGWMNQAIAKVADRVTFVAAGLPMELKSSPDLSGGNLG